jgi:hypothetical protein
MLAVKDSECKLILLVLRSTSAGGGLHKPDTSASKVSLRNIPAV